MRPVVNITDIVRPNNCFLVGNLSCPAGMAERFWEKVRRTDGCWWWTASTLKPGRFRLPYGQFAVRSGGRFRNLKAHRVAWELTHGPIPAGLSVLHRCDNPRCVNPSHLFLGTQGDNIRDAARKGRLHVARPARRKVSDADIQAMRELRAEGWPMERIGERFGVSGSLVSLVLRGKRRALPEPSFHALSLPPAVTGSKIKSFAPVQE